MEEAVVHHQPPRRGLLALGAVALIALIAAQLFVSPFVAIAGVLAVLFVVFAFARPLGALAFVALYLPFEPFLLRFVPNDLYAFVRYVPEGLIYLLCIVVAMQVWQARRSLKHTPLSAPFVLFLILLLASILINAVPPAVAVLGVRQIIRFILVFFLVVELKPNEAYVKRLTVSLFAVLLFEAGLGILQRVSGGALDPVLLPSATHTFADITLSTGVDQFWDPGSRIFATFGRYDVLGNFLAFFLAIGTGFLYEPTMRKGWKSLWWIFALGLPALVFTYSRASWFAFLIGFLFVAVYLRRDRRVMIAFASAVAVLLLYVGASGLNVRFITEAPGQTVVERFYEAFSYARWRGEYYGLGRVFWMVQTPLVVVPAAPFFGVGPGQYGGGAVAALGNTRAYERLGLPFGVFGSEGSIDNNWFSIWGETGTLGLLTFLWMYFTLIGLGIKAHKGEGSPFTRALGAGYAAALLGGLLIAFLATSLEIRTYAFYLWMYGGFVYVLSKHASHDHHPS